MIPEVLVGDGLRRARRMARELAGSVHEETGCHLVAVVAEMDGPAHACTSMAVDPTLEDKPDTEVSLMKCALARVLSLLVLHLGYRGALECAIAATAQGAELARLASDEASAG